MSSSENLRIVLFGLDETLSSELRSVLAGRQPAIYTQPFLAPAECLGVVDQVGADLIFCSSDRERYAALLEAVERHKPDLPVVIVSRDPEVSEWLDAIEAGASDYCAAPFETSHIEWILESVLKHPYSQALRRASG
jgi:DNA-binding NtrC family response regulator